MAEQWELILNQAIPEYVKEVVDATIYKRLWLSMLQARGKVKLGVPGSYAKKRPVDWKEVPIQDFTHGTNPDYAPRDYLKWVEMGWKGSYASDSMDYIEYKEIAHSPNTVVDRYARIIPKMLQGLRNFIGKQLYSDSTATGNSNGFDGVETACGDSTCAVGDLVALPDGSYQGLDTDLAQAGTWSTDLTTSPNSTIATDWPEGSGDSEYAYRAPKLVNWSSNAWGTSKVTWESNCQRAVSRTADWIRTTYGGEGEGSSLMGMFSTGMMSGFKNSLRASNLILTPHRESDKLGFGDVLNFEGVGMHSEYGCPVNTGYILDMDDITISFLGDKMIETFGPFKESDMMWKWNAIVLGNIELNPRRLAKLYNYAAA